MWIARLLSLSIISGSTYCQIDGIPKFLSLDDRPHDTIITEGNSISFNCKALAFPEATVTWYRNGEQIDVNAPPKRYSFSNDTKTLTIQNLCRNCDDRPESAQSDIGVIQCNASNVHGYDFGAGYLNVLAKTQVMIISDEKNVEVEINEERRVVFVCNATSDPITPVTPEWWHLPYDGYKRAVPVSEDPPAVTLKDGQLVIHVIPGNNKREWVKYHGIYNCTASNNYSSDWKHTTITIKDYVAQDAMRVTYWWLVLLVLLILLLMILFIVCCCCCLRRNRGDIHHATTKEIHEKIHYEMVPCEEYETIPCDVLSTNQSPSHVDQSRQTMDNVTRSNAVESTYSMITDSIDGPAYDYFIATSEGERRNILTAQYDENAQLNDDYTGSTDRDNAYSTYYTDREGAEVRTLNNSPTTTSPHDENTEETSDYTGLTDRENAKLNVYTGLQQDAEIETQENALSEGRMKFK